MTGQDLFSWHAAARLFAGADAIAKGRPTSSFKTLRGDHPEALQGLGAAIASGGGFFIHDQDLPDNLSPKPGQFFTASGGSSGTPRIIARTQASWTASFAVNAERFDLGPGRRLAVLGRLSHSLALYGVLEGLHLGLEVHVLAGLSPHRQCAQLVKTGTDVLYATPTQMRLLARAGEVLPEIRLILLGGAPLDSATRRSISALCPQAAVHVFYGAAETSFISMSDPDAPEGSVGRAYPGVEVVVQGGEVWVRSPYLFDGYAFGDSPDTRWQDGFLSVGERGRMDADGRLWIEGRNSRVIKVADQNVSPEAAEMLIMAHFQPTACAVLPSPDRMRGQRLVAVIEGEEDRELSAQIMQHCREKLGPHASPARVFFRPALPHLTSGKIDLTELAQWLETRA